MAIARLSVEQKNFKIGPLRYASFLPSSRWVTPGSVCTQIHHVAGADDNNFFPDLLLFFPIFAILMVQPTSSHRTMVPTRYPIVPTPER